MDYEKKYNEMLDDARYWHDVSEGDIPTVLEEIFPELRESEDERIRKRIIHALHGDVLDMEETTKAISWLEKQGSIDIDIESMVSSYKQRLKSQGQGNLENNPLINMCVSAFKQGVENTLEELNLKKL